MAELFNMDYLGFADFAEHNAEYVAFLTELHRRLAARGKSGRLPPGQQRRRLHRQRRADRLHLRGDRALRSLSCSQWGGPWVAVAKLAIVLFFVPLLVRYIRRAKPAIYDPLALPPDALPQPA